MIDKKTFETEMKMFNNETKMSESEIAEMLEDMAKIQGEN